MSTVSEQIISCNEKDGGFNPLLGTWSTPHGLPPFKSIRPSHYEDALKEGMKQQLLDIEAICQSTVIDFDTVIAEFDRSGQLFNRVGLVYENLCSSDCPPELQAVQLKMAGPLAAHSNALYMYPGLFQKIDRVYENRLNKDWSLNSEQIRLVERIHLDFIRAGAKFNGDTQVKYAAITEKLAELETMFAQNILTDESEYTIVLKKEDLAGIPPSLVLSAKQAAVERNLGEDDYVITLSRSLVEPFITLSDRRDLRERAWRAWTKRGELDPSRNNKKLILDILSLRQQQAAYHGYKNYAEYATADTMAGSPEAVMSLLQNVWSRGKASADRERIALLEYSNDIAGGSEALVTKIEPWDWRYFAEKVRQSKFDLDQNELKPYFSLDVMVDAVFDCAKQLFGLTFRLNPSLETYHLDVKAYEVFENIDGVEQLVGIFLHDNFARQNKQSGAWMSVYRSQTRNCDKVGTKVIPIVVNNNNFAKGDPTLLSFDDAVTLFHEFGHGMHGMLSDVTYSRLGGTNVLRDFVELPSQLFEHWLSQREVLKKHARHYVTGEPIPDELLDRLMKAKNFNQGFATVEYTASALIDQYLHTTVVPTEDSSNNESKSSTEDLASSSSQAPRSLAVLTDVDVFEANVLQNLGIPEGLAMRHRPAHFLHLFSSSAYAAAYYVYLWAEVLDADGFDAFLETGNVFDSTTAAKLRKFIYSSGNSIDPAIAFRNFRGRDPIIDPMLKKKGLLL